MDVMTLLSAPASTPFTRADLDALPEDGRRHELIDGVLIMSPAPRPLHQTVLTALWRVIDDAAPPEFKTLVAPLDVALGDDTVLEPDLVVAPRTAFSDKDLPTAPTIAIEILSPSTRRFDLTVKKDRLEAAGCPHYWVVDPDEPSLTCWTLTTDGHYTQTTHTTGNQPAHLNTPFPVTITPARLID